jgi:hypothetical protein
MSRDGATRAISTLEYQRVRRGLAGSGPRPPRVCGRPQPMRRHVQSPAPRNNKPAAPAPPRPRRQENRQRQRHPPAPPAPAFGAILSSAAARAAAAAAAAAAASGGACAPRGSSRSGSGGGGARPSEIRLQDEGYIYAQLVAPSPGEVAWWGPAHRLKAGGVLACCSFRQWGCRARPAAPFTPHCALPVTTARLTHRWQPRPGSAACAQAAAAAGLRRRRRRPRRARSAAGAFRRAERAGQLAAAAVCQWHRRPQPPKQQHRQRGRRGRGCARRHQKQPSDSSRSGASKHRQCSGASGRRLSLCRLLCDGRDQRRAAAEQRQPWAGSGASRCR